MALQLEKISGHGPAMVELKMVTLTPEAPPIIASPSTVHFVVCFSIHLLWLYFYFMIHR